MVPAASEEPRRKVVVGVGDRGGEVNAVVRSCGHLGLGWVTLNRECVGVTDWVE